MDTDAGLVIAEDPSGALEPVVDGLAFIDREFAAYPPGVPGLRSTARPGCLYLHIHEWPAENVLRVDAASLGDVRSARVLGDPDAALAMDADNDTLAITLPAEGRDEHVTVVALEAYSRRRTY